MEWDRSLFSRFLARTQSPHPRRPTSTIHFPSLLNTLRIGKIHRLVQNKAETFETCSEIETLRIRNPSKQSQVGRAGDRSDADGLILRLPLLHRPPFTLHPTPLVSIIAVSALLLLEPGAFLTSSRSYLPHVLIDASKSAQLGGLSLICRQTNIIWIGFVVATSIIRELTLLERTRVSGKGAKKGGSQLYDPLLGQSRLSKCRDSSSFDSFIKIMLIRS